MTDGVQERVLSRCRNDLEFHAENLLKILDPDGRLIPMVFRQSQRELHEKIEKQKQETGSVRAFVLKAR